MAKGRSDRSDKLEQVLPVFYEIGRALARGDNYDAVVKAVVKACTELTRSDTGSVLIVDPASGSLIHRIGHRMGKAERLISFAPGEGVAGWVAAHGEPANIADVRRDPRFAAKRGQHRRMRSLLCVPVRLRRKVVGVLSVTSERIGAFGAPHTRFLLFLAAMIAVDLENARLEALASRDPLTGIANRRRLEEAIAASLDQAAKSRCPVAVAILDLDHFKRINDRFGHPAGDQVLKQAVTRWSQALRAVDLLARVGGDEFGLLLPGADAARVSEIAERLRRHVGAEPFRIRGATIRATVSIGVAVSARGRTPERLMASADRALYRAKRAGRDRVRVVRI
jgi:diguanylate cyclase (GGDEF)-like protein